MPAIRRQLIAALAVAAMLPFVLPTPAWAAATDNNVEWAGVSHLQWQDLRPRCPIQQDDFQVRFQTWRNDITSAQVIVTFDPSGPDPPVTTPHAASKVGTRGPYDVWQAQVPRLTGFTLKESYVIELTDGTDTDYYGPDGMSDGVPASEFKVDFYYFDHAPYGATPTSDGGAVFKVWSPTRALANVAGEFNGWLATQPLNKFTGTEFFAKKVPAPVAIGSAYKFVFPYPNFNDGIWKPDVRARSIDPFTFNSRVEDPDGYAWQIEDFETPPLAKMVIYQLHVGTFSGRNDPLGTPPFPGGYADVTARAGHLADLGVNAVMLNPITEFPLEESAGYNPITAWSPESAYGTPDELKAMVDALHAHGIAVLLDILWNHIDGDILNNYDGTQQWYDVPDPVDTPWGWQADFDKEAVRDYYVHSALYWLEEFKLDGFRMDATDFMNMDGSPQAGAGWTLMQRFNDAIDNRWVDKVAIAEQLPDDSWVTRPTAMGGAGFDSQYFDLYTDNMRQEIFDAAFGSADMGTIAFITTYNDTYMSKQRVMNYIELHDEAWPSSGGQRMVKTIDPTFPHDDQWAQGRMKLGLGYTMFAPGVPAMLMGDEWLEDTDFGTGAGNRIDWSKKTAYAGYYEYIKRIVHLRTTVDAFRADRYVSVTHLNEGGDVIAFFRNDAQGRPFVVVANFGNADYASYQLGVPWGGDWVEMVNSQSSAYGGNGMDNPGAIHADQGPYDGLGQSVRIKVPKMGLIVLGPASIVDVASGPPPAPATRIERVSPVPARDGATVSFALAEAGEAGVEVLDVAGRRIARVASGAFGAGRHSVRWDGRDEVGRAAAPGLYFVRLSTAAGFETRRLPLVR